jgi:acyl carrier protein
MTPAEIALAVHEIVTAVANEHGGACDVIKPESTLHDHLGMDEADIIAVMFRAEARFGISLPDRDIGFSSTLSDVVDLIADRLSDKRAVLPSSQSSPISANDASAPLAARSSIVR